MNHIILDTNMLMAVAQFRVDILAELRRICDFPYDISIIDKTIGELKKIQKEQRGAHRLAATIALSLIQKNNIKIITTTATKPVDDILADFSHNGFIIATQDMALKKRLKKPYITLRKKKYLMLL